MTGKPTRSADSFAASVKMSSKALFLVVEGPKHDRTFYDRLLLGHETIRNLGHEIQLTGEIDLCGTVAGGKEHTYSVFNYYRQRGVLLQRNSRGSRYIVFMLDRDFDDFKPNVPLDPHLIRTSKADVEAEILLNGDVSSAIASAYSLSSSQVDELLPSGCNIGDLLADNWRAWITLGVLFVKLGKYGARYANASEINIGKYGELDTQRESSLRMQALAGISEDESEAVLTEVATLISAIYSGDRKSSLVKGRWLVEYLHYHVEQYRIGGRKIIMPAPNVVVNCCMMTLDFSGPWTAYFSDHLNQVLTA